MRYDPDVDEYTCQAGKKLRVVYVGKRQQEASGLEEIH